MGVLQEDEKGQDDAGHHKGALEGEHCGSVVCVLKERMARPGWKEVGRKYSKQNRCWTLRCRGMCWLRCAGGKLIACVDGRVQRCMITGG